MAPAFRPPGPEDELLSRYHDLIDRRAWLVRGGVSLLFGLIAGVGVSAEWNQWILFTHAQPFGIKDATFHTDVGFYVFRLPFYQSVAPVAVRLADHHPPDHRGGPLPQRRHPAADPAAAGHPAGEGPPVGAAGPARRWSRRLDYWLDRYALDLLHPGLRQRRHLHRRQGPAAGAQPADVHRPAVVRAVHLQHLAAGLGAAGRWPSACGPWWSIVAGTAYPAFVQKFQVQPTESSKEAPYITNNILATRQALELTDVKSQTYDSGLERGRPPARPSPTTRARCRTSACSTRST